MTRRDYLNGTFMGAGALLTRGVAPADALNAEAFDGYGGIGDYDKSNGSTWQVLTEGHRLRDGAFNSRSASVIDTGERYDCVIVGGGISGLAAALFFTGDAGPKRKCLVLDNHAIFGGLAKRNEFRIQGQRVISNQASAMFFPPLAGSFLESFYRGIGIDPHGWDYQGWKGGEPQLPVGNTPYFAGTKNSGYYFGSRFGKPSGSWVIDPWGSELEGAPISDIARQELLKVHRAPETPLPKEHGDAQSRHMDAITLEQYLMELHGISRETVRNFISPVAGGGAGIGADALSAYAEYAADVLLPWDHSRGVQMFPGGNTGVARHILKSLLPDAIAGEPTMQGVCRGLVNFSALDRRKQAARIRLRSTVFSVEQDREGAKIFYSLDGKLYRVRARTVIMAGGSWTTRRIVPDLPSDHRDAYSRFYRSPCLVANVALRDWRFLYRMGITEFQWFDGIGNYTAVRRLATFGDVAPAISPDSPVVLTMKILFSYPGLSLDEQNKRGRSELLAAPYRDYERQIREQFHRMFAHTGFDAKRDITAIILNRWGHAYLSAQPGFFFGAPGQPAPGEFLRRHTFGRITFANSDLSGIMDHRASIQEARRAVKQCLETNLLN